MYTRKGDSGQTGILGSGRVAKDSPRVEAYGTVDELNSCIGAAMSFCNDKRILAELREVQRFLFVAGADLANDTDEPRNTLPRITSHDTEQLETSIDSILNRLPKLTKFILPGGGRTAAQLHLARAICRRAERRIVSAKGAEKINPELLPFFNRLSTLLFDLARYANHVEKRKEEEWSSRKSRTVSPG